jgi:cation:H+ antiporter
MNLLSLLGGFALLLMGAESLVRGAAKLALQLGISPLVVGLTVVAFGTSAPELTVSIAAAINGEASIALGNVVGSNVLNILVILGASAVVTPLAVTQQLIRVEIPLMVVVSLVVWGMAANDNIGRLEGALLFGSLVIYLCWAVTKSKQETKAVQREYARSLGADEVSPAEQADNRTHWRLILLQVALVCAGLAMLVLGANLLVQGAVGMATSWGIPPAVIGLTIVAGGTSLPEVATSLMAAFRGEQDIAIGNVVGSNLFNLMSVLGGTAMVSATGIAVESSFLRFDFPVMVMAACICLPIAWTGQRVSRAEGLFLLASYVVYVVVTVV